MRFTPASEAEIASTGLLPVGDYDFEVEDAEEAKSKSSGADMIALRVAIFPIDGSKRHVVFDYLVVSPKSQFKVRHFAQAVGLLGAYEAGRIDAGDIIGRRGRCKIVVRKDRSGAYPDKNMIADYIGTNTTQTPPSSRPAEAKGPRFDLDDEVPF